MYFSKCGHYFSRKDKHKAWQFNCKELNFFWGGRFPLALLGPSVFVIALREGDVGAARNVKLMMPRTPWWDLWYLQLIPWEICLFALPGCNHAPLQTQHGQSFVTFRQAHATVSQQSLRSATSILMKLKAAHTTQAAHINHQQWSYGGAYQCP